MSCLHDISALTVDVCSAVYGFVKVKVVVIFINRFSAHLG